LKKRKDERMPAVNDFPNLDGIIQPGWKVADYGGGTNPHPRADVVVDIAPGAHTGVREGAVDARDTQAEIRIGNVCALESIVEDKEFDFVIASHIAEHVDNPGAFCRELLRTSRAGYIETPSPLYEVFFDWIEHKWLVDVRSDRLCFLRKTELNCPGREFFDSMGGHTGSWEHLRGAHAPWLRTKFLWNGAFDWVIDE
jgi:hypothetical protein